MSVLKAAEELSENIAFRIVQQGRLTSPSYCFILPDEYNKALK